jgi:hypothetical protein
MNILESRISLLRRAKSHEVSQWGLFFNQLDHEKSNDTELKSNMKKYPPIKSNLLVLNDSKSVEFIRDQNSFVVENDALVRKRFAPLKALKFFSSRSPYALPSKTAKKTSRLFSLFHFFKDTV